MDTYHVYIYTCTVAGNFTCNSFGIPVLPVYIYRIVPNRGTLSNRSTPQTDIAYEGPLCPITAVAMGSRKKYHPLCVLHTVCRCNG